jgi:cob(I)alamin adenosyltransferase
MSHAANLESDAASSSSVEYSMELGDRNEFTIGELASAAGVTVRAVRHYEAVGLLPEADRSTGGHRRYEEAALRRLRQILKLRDCGFGLAAIQQLLDARSPGTTLELARRQLERTEIELEVGRRLRLRLQRFVSMLESSSADAIDRLIDDMEVDKMSVSLDRISTGLGDAGETDLGDGTRVKKGHPLIVAGGALDELAAQIGLALVEHPIPEHHRTWLERIENDLMDIGSDLSSPPGKGSERPRIDSDYVAWLERACTEANAPLEAIDSFVTWFKTPLAARLNACRAACRRAEREVFAVDSANPQIGRYLNRLSDLLFILSRAEAAGAEAYWKPGAGAELARG